MEKLKILLVANNLSSWSSWPEKIKQLKDWFSQKFSLVEIDLVHTKYQDIPFTKYVSADPNQNNFTMQGVEPSWYDFHITPIAVGGGYDIILFVVPESQWKLGDNMARGWRADNDQGVVQTHIMGQENSDMTFGLPNNGIEHITTFYWWARHEINHALYMLADQKDNTHLYGDATPGPKKVLDELVFKEPNTADKISFLKRLIAGLMFAIGLHKEGRFPQYEQDVNFPMKTPPASPQRPTLDQFCLAIQEHEGWFPAGTAGYPTGSRSWRNKNPGNIKYVGQARAIGKDTKNFCIFDSYADGFETLKDLIRFAVSGKSKWYKPDMSIRQFFAVYAPSYDNNNPTSYANTVAKKLGVDVDYKIKDIVNG